MPTEAILSTARQFLGVDPTVPITLVPIKRGASGRTIVRVKAPNQETFIGVHWTEEREDNGQFVPIAQFLKQAKLRVPAIIQPRMPRKIKTAAPISLAREKAVGDAKSKAVRP